MLHALLKQARDPGIDLKDYLDIVALATLADLVPLSVRTASSSIAGFSNWQDSLAGPRRIDDDRNVRPPLRGSDIGFRLGPRINASGRLGHRLESLRLLLCDDIREATQLAESLDRQNSARQSVERALIVDVEQWVEEHYDPLSHASIVAGRAEWHHGVLGIVAARVMQRHHRPTLLVGFDESGLGKGSGRSIEGLSLVDALRQCACHLEKFGGHEMAAGVTVHQDRFEEFRRAFEISRARASTTRSSRPNCDSMPNCRLKTSHSRCSKCRKCLSLTEWEIRSPFLPREWSRRRAHATRAQRTASPVGFPRRKRFVQAIYFRGAEESLPQPPWDIAFTLERNEFNGVCAAKCKSLPFVPQLAALEIVVAKETQISSKRSDSSHQPVVKTSAASTGSNLRTASQRCICPPKAALLLNEIKSSCFPPEAPLGDLEWIPRKGWSPCRLGLSTLGDLLEHYPRRYEDRRRFDRFPDDEMDHPACLFGLVTKTSLKRIGGWRRMFEITLENESAGVLSQPLTCRWFNMPYIQKMIAVGHHLVLFGRPKKQGRQIVIDTHLV